MSGAQGSREAGIEASIEAGIEASVEASIEASIEAIRALSPDWLDALDIQAAAGIDFTELYVRRGEYRDLVLQAIGSDLNGYELEDLALDYLEQTPIEQLDPQNILDAEGIRKIKAMAAATKKDEG